MLNQLILQGRLTKDVELRRTASGKDVASFTLATDNRAKDETTFIGCTAFDTVGNNLAKYCTKGDMICVIGAINQRRYQKQDGTNASVIEVIVNSVEFLQPKKEEPQDPNPAETMGDPVLEEKHEDVRNLEGTSEELPPLPSGWHYEDGKPVKDAPSPKKTAPKKK